MGLFDLQRKFLRFNAPAIVCLLLSLCASAALAQSADKEKSGLRDYNQERPQRIPVNREGLRPPAPGSLPKKPASMPKRYSFSTPFIWTLELFLITFGLTTVVYLYKRYKKRLYRTR